MSWRNIFVYLQCIFEVTQDKHLKNFNQSARHSYCRVFANTTLTMEKIECKCCKQKYSLSECEVTTAPTMMGRRIQLVCAKCYTITEVVEYKQPRIFVKIRWEICIFEKYCCIFAVLKLPDSCLSRWARSMLDDETRAFFYAPTVLVKAIAAAIRHYLRS